MPKENMIMRTSLSNKRAMLRGYSSNPPIEASSSSNPHPRGSLASQRRMKKENKRRLAEANKQLNVSHEDGVIKVEGIPPKNVKYHMKEES